MSEELRIDKWLWAARFFKTRALAQTALENGRVMVAGERVKRSRALHVGDSVWMRIGDTERTVVVLALSGTRGSAPISQALYRETPESLERREQLLARRRLFTEPASAIEQGRPTKRERRELERWRTGSE